MWGGVVLWGTPQLNTSGWGDGRTKGGGAGQNFRDKGIHRVTGVLLETCGIPLNKNAATHVRAKGIHNMPVFYRAPAPFTAPLPDPSAPPPRNRWPVTRGCLAKPLDPGGRQNFAPFRVPGGLWQNMDPVQDNDFN